ncbi:MAG: ion channel [Methylotenera sp.]
MWSILEVILGFILVACSLTVHSIGMYVVMHRFELNWSVFLHEKNEFRRQLYLGQLVMIMLLTHIFEVLLIAVILYGIQAFHDLRTAFYFTGETYTTLGFGDILLPSGWRQLALFIAMSGLFAFGWSTGVLVSIVGKTYEAQFSNLRKHDRNGKSLDD